MKEVSSLLSSFADRAFTENMFSILGEFLGLLRAYFERFAEKLIATNDLKPSLAWLDKQNRLEFLSSLSQHSIAFNESFPAPTIKGMACEITLSMLERFAGAYETLSVEESRTAAQRLQRRYFSCIAIVSIKGHLYLNAFLWSSSRSCYISF